MSSNTKKKSKEGVSKNMYPGRNTEELSKQLGIRLGKLNP